MYMVYRPKGQLDEAGEQETRVWHFIWDEFQSRDAEDIEAATGMNWLGFTQAVQAGSSLARRALLWVFERATHPSLKFKDVRYTLGEVSLEYDQTELVDQLAALDDLPDAVVYKMGGQGVVDALRIRAQEALESARPAPGKAPWQPSDSAISSDSASSESPLVSTAG